MSERKSIRDEDKAAVLSAAQGFSLPDSRGTYETEDVQDKSGGGAAVA
jgi:hypothetical protein